MADKTIASSWRYRVELIYLDLAKGTNVTIKNECVKSIIVDHNYDINCMPILYVNAVLDKALIDNMILNIDTNLLTLAIYKYDELMDHELDIECFRKKFTYFLPDDINKNDPIDYNEVTVDQNLGDTYKPVSFGLLSIDLINNNKRSIEMNAKDTNMYDLVKYLTSHISNILIEPFNYNNTFDQLIIPPLDSVNKALMYLNNQKVFYKTPYRYYQDFDCTYILSSGGYAVARKSDKYTSVIFDIKEITDIEANDQGLIHNKTRSNYKVIVNAADTAVYNNSISNKSKNKIRGITSSGNTVKSLSGNADYSTDKITNYRLNNDNEHMIDNIKADYNSSNVYVNISKNNLDSTVFTINKKYSINHIDRYIDFNGDYLLSRKRELYLREDETFVMNMILNLRKFEA